MAISNVQTRLRNLEDILKQLNEEIRQKNETAATIENDIVKKNSVIERKQNMVDQYNKRIEVLKNKDGVGIHVLFTCCLNVVHMLYECCAHVDVHVVHELIVALFYIIDISVSAKLFSLEVK